MLVFCILLILFYVSHSILAANGVKQIMQQKYPKIFPFYRLFYTLFSGGFFLLIIWWFVEKHENSYLFELNVVFKFMGTILFIAGLSLTGWSVWRYGFAEFTGINSFLKTENTKLKESPALNTSGINAWVRHPIYTGIVFAMLGLLFLLPTIMTLSAIIITCIYLEIGIRLEERKLIEEFGVQYIEYRKKVKKVIPLVY